MSKNRKRFWEIDALRGIAIMMMIVFHLMWDMKYFGFISFNLYAGFWGIFQIATAGLFLLLAGMMVALGAQKHRANYSLCFLKRGGMVFGFGLLITLVTVILFPENFIYFGILHLIGVSIILSIPIARRKFLPLVLALIFIIAPLIWNLQSAGINFLVWVGFAVPKPTLDFEPLFPWFGAFLIGIFLFNLFYLKAKRIFELKQNNSFLSKKLQFLGRHSLLIYLIHQPILFELIYLIANYLI